METLTKVLIKAYLTKIPPPPHNWCSPSQERGRGGAACGLQRQGRSSGKQKAGASKNVVRLFKQITIIALNKSPSGYCVIKRSKTGIINNIPVPQEGRQEQTPATSSTPSLPILYYLIQPANLIFSYSVCQSYLILSSLPSNSLIS